MQRWLFLLLGLLLTWSPGAAAQGSFRSFELFGGGPQIPLSPMNETATLNFTARAGCPSDYPAHQWTLVQFSAVNPPNDLAILSVGPSPAPFQFPTDACATGSPTHDFNVTANVRFLRNAPAYAPVPFTFQANASQSQIMGPPIQYASKRVQANETPRYSLGADVHPNETFAGIAPHRSFHFAQTATWTANAPTMLTIRIRDQSSELLQFRLPPVAHFQASGLVAQTFATGIEMEAPKAEGYYVFNASFEFGFDGNPPDPRPPAPVSMLIPFTVQVSKALGNGAVGDVQFHTPGPGEATTLLSLVAALAFRRRGRR